MFRGAKIERRRLGHPIVRIQKLTEVQEIRVSTWVVWLGLGGNDHLN